MTDTSKVPPEFTALAILADEMVEATLLAQTAAVALIAELPTLATAAPQSAQDLAKVDAAVEASFDNMPV